MTSPEYKRWIQEPKCWWIALRNKSNFRQSSNFVAIAMIWIIAWSHCFFCWWAACSFGRSPVTYAEQTVWQNWWSSWPRMVVTESKRPRVRSVCIQSLARACHSASQYKRVITILLCWGASRPSNIGIMHCHMYMLEYFPTLWCWIPIPATSPQSSRRPFSSSQMRY